MATNYFEQLADNQKKMMESWMDYSNKVMEQVQGGNDATKASQELLTDWYEKQKDLMTETMQPANMQESMTKAPDNYRKMMELQMEYSRKWMELAQHQMKEAMPASMNMGDWSKMFPQGGNSLVEQWINQTNQMIRSQMSSTMMPSMMMPMRMDSFGEVYKEMQKYWEPIQKSIQSGMMNEEMLKTWVAPDFYQDMMSKMMNFSMPDMMKTVANQATTMFTDYNQWLTEQTSGFTQQFPMNFTFSGENNPWMNMMQDMQARMEKMYAPMMMMNPGKQSKMMELMREAQNEYVNFALKGTEFQMKLAQAGQKAFPEAVMKINETYQKEEKLPDYNEFFNTFVGLVESYLINIFETSEYSALQNEMSMAGVKVKNRMEKLMEMTFEGAPFTMRSETEELVKEVAELKRKLRSMEKSLKEAKAEAPAPTATTTKASTTASKTTKTRNTRSKKSTAASKNTDAPSN